MGVGAGYMFSHDDAARVVRSRSGAFRRSRGSSLSSIGGSARSGSSSGGASYASFRSGGSSGGGASSIGGASFRSAVSSSGSASVGFRSASSSIGGGEGLDESALDTVAELPRPVTMGLGANTTNTAPLSLPKVATTVAAAASPADQAQTQRSQESGYSSANWHNPAREILKRMASLQKTTNAFKVRHYGPKVRFDAFSWPTFPLGVSREQSATVCVLCMTPLCHTRARAHTHSQHEVPGPGSCTAPSRSVHTHMHTLLHPLQATAAANKDDSTLNAHSPGGAGEGEALRPFSAAVAAGTLLPLPSPPKRASESSLPDQSHAAAVAPTAAFATAVAQAHPAVVGMGRSSDAGTAASSPFQLPPLPIRRALSSGGHDSVAGAERPSVKEDAGGVAAVVEEAGVEHGRRACDGGKQKGVRARLPRVSFSGDITTYADATKSDTVQWRVSGGGAGAEQKGHHAAVGHLPPLAPKRALPTTAAHLA